MCIAIFVKNIFICSSYSRAATITATSRSLRPLFEDSYYSSVATIRSAAFIQEIRYIRIIIHIYAIPGVMPPISA